MKILNIDGFKVLYSKRPNNIITVQALINAGSAKEDNPNIYGTAHCLEHMFFKGTINKSANQLGRELSALGSGNAYTNYIETCYYINTIADNCGEALMLLGEMLFESKFEKEELEKEKNVILEEYKAYLDNPTSFYSGNVAEEILGRQGHSILGTEKSIKDLSINTLINYKKKFYNKNNMVFIVVGNIQEDIVKKSMSKMLAKYKKSLFLSSSGKIERKPLKIDYKPYDFRHTSEQAIVGFIMRALSPQEIEDCNYANVLFTAAFGRDIHSILYNKIREKLGLCYAVGMFETGFENNNFTEVYVMLNKNNIEKASEEIMKQLKLVAKNGVSKELLEVARRYTIFQLADILESSYGYASVVSDHYFETGKGDISYKKYCEAFNKVKNKDIMEYANWMIEDGVKIVCMNGK